MNSDLYFSGKQYISAKRASRLVGYSPDYIGQLCRGGKVQSRLMGKTRYVSVESLNSYIETISPTVKNQPKTIEVSDNKILYRAAEKSSENFFKKITPRTKFFDAKKLNVFPEVAESLTKKIKAPFYAHYPKILSYMNESSKSQRSFVFETILKKALLGSFIFIFMFDLGNTFGAGLLNHSMDLARAVSTKTVATLTGFEGVVGRTVVDGYEMVGNVLSRAPRTNVAIPTPIKKTSLIHFKAQLEDWNTNPTEKFALTVPVIAPVTLDKNIVRTPVAVSLKGDFVNTVSGVKAGAQALQDFATTYNKTSAGMLSTVYGALRDVSSLYSVKVTETSIGSSRDLLSFSRDTLDLFARGEQNIGNVAAVVANATTSGNAVDQAGSYVYRKFQSLFGNKNTIGNSKAFTSTTPPSTKNTPVVSPVITQATTTQRQTAIQTVIQRITERPQITQNIQQTYTGVSSIELNARLSDLERSTLSRFSSLSSGNGGSVTNIYQQIAGSQRIDTLSGTSIANPTITGGSFSGGSISATTISANSINIIGDVSLATTTLADLTISTTTPGCAQFGITGKLFSTGVDCGTGSGGGSLSSFATTTSLVLGQNINYSVEDTDILAIGGNSTSSAKYWFNPNTQTSYLSGSVGVGTSSPAATFAVSGNTFLDGNSTTTGRLFAGNDIQISRSSIPTAGLIYFGNTTANYLSFDGSNFMFNGSGALLTAGSQIIAQSNSNALGIGSKFSAGSGAVYFGGTNSATPDALFSNTAGIEIARISNSGNLGLGTTTPNTTLSVNGNSYISGTGFFGGAITGTSTLNISGLATFTNASSSLLSANTGFFNSILATSTTQFSGFGATTTPFAQLSVNSVAGSPAFVVGSSTATSFIVDKNGNVGVGTASPTSKLQVVGTSNGSLNYSFTTWPTTAARNDFDITVGYQFVVGTKITVSQLGRLYVAGNSQDHQIGIWNYRTGALIASATILNASASDSNNFKWVSITPVVLDPADIYSIGTLEYLGGDTWTTSWSTENTMNQNIKRTGQAYAIAASLTKPVLQGIGTTVYGSAAMAFTTFSDTQITSSYDADTSAGINVRPTGDATLMLSKNDKNVSVLGGFSVGHGSVESGYVFDVLGKTNLVADGATLTLNSTDGTTPLIIGTGNGGALGTTNTWRYDNSYSVINGGSGGLLFNYDSPLTRVGIGAILPLSTFDVNGGVAIGSYAGNNVAPSNGLIVSGNVGIASSSPTSALSVNGNSYISGTSFFGGAITATSTLNVTGLATFTNSSTSLLSATTGFFNRILATSTTQFSGFGATTTPFAQLSVNSVAGSPAFVVGSSTGTSFIVDRSGNVGVGTSTPPSLLTISPTVAQLTSTVNPVFLMGTSTLVSPSSSGTYFGINAPSTFAGDQINIQSGGSSVFKINASGGYIQTPTAIHIGTVAGSTGMKIYGGTSQLFATNVGSMATFGNSYGSSMFGFVHNTGNWSESVDAMYNLIGTTNSLGTAIQFVPTGTQTAASINGFNMNMKFAPSNASAVVKGRWVGIASTPIFGSGIQAYNSTSTVATWLTGIESAPIINVKNTSTVGYAALVVNPLEVSTSTAQNYLALFQNSSSTKVAITAEGAFGIGTTSPWRSLSVTGTVGFDGVTSATTGNYLCLNTTTKEVTSGTSCTLSSERFKVNIASLTAPRDFDFGTSTVATSTLAASALETVMALRPVTYNFKPGYGDDGAGVQLGFIAEEAAQVDPRLVPYDKDGIPNGFYYQTYTAVLTKAMQEMNINLVSIASSTAPVSTFQTTFFENLFARVTTWLASATNGVGAIFANTFHAKEQICIDDQCLTKDDVKALVQMAHGQTANAGGSGNTGGGQGTTTPATDTTDPVISVTGENPATITVGTTYVDLGATVTDTDANGATNTNLGIQYKVDDVDMQDVVIGTSVPGDHVITYTATDGAGNVGTATRTVSVVAQ